MKERLLLYYDGESYLVELVQSNYVDNNNLYLGLFDPQNGPFGDLTVNIKDLPYNQAAVNVNNGPWVEQFIKLHNLGEPTGLMLQSGFCTYPIYQFDMKRIEEFTKEY